MESLEPFVLPNIYPSAFARVNLQVVWHLQLTEEQQSASEFSNHPRSRRGALGQGPQMLLLPWQLAGSIDFSPLTKIHQATVWPRTHSHCISSGVQKDMLCTPPLVKATQKYQITMILAPTVAWTGLQTPMVSWCKKGEYNAQISPKSEPCGVKWANPHNKCVHDPMVTGKFVTKPMSYVAALHLYRIKLGLKLYIPYARCSFDKDVAFTRGGTVWMKYYVSIRHFGIHIYNQTSLVQLERCRGQHDGCLHTTFCLSCQPLSL